MPEIILDLPDATMVELERRARERKRTVEEVAGEIIESAVGGRDERRPSLVDRKPFHVGKVFVPFTSTDGLLEEMLEDKFPVPDRPV